MLLHISKISLTCLLCAWYHIRWWTSLQKGTGGVNIYQDMEEGGKEMSTDMQEKGPQDRNQIRDKQLQVRKTKISYKRKCKVLKL
jgi:hypothetical protein